MNITADLQTFEAKSLDTREALIDEVWRGLRKRPRSLVPWMLYSFVVVGSHESRLVLHHIRTQQQRIAGPELRPRCIASIENLARILTLAASGIARAGIAWSRASRCIWRARAISW